MVKEEKTKIKIITPKDIPTYSVSGFFGGLAESEGIIKIIEDDIVPKIDEKGNYSVGSFQKKFLANLKMSPLTWKRMAYWLIKHVQEYEKKHGKIKGKDFDKRDESVDYEMV